MGSSSIKGYDIYCCTKKYIKEKDFWIENQYNTQNEIKKITSIQAHVRGHIFRCKINSRNNTEIKEISIDYSTDSQENNQVILRLNNLLPKFELSEKETYYINNSNLKIVALLYPNKSIYKGMVNSRRLREGFGKLYLSDGSIYKGFFHNNKMEGRGRLLNINGFVYEGEFKKGLSNGYGKYVALDGTTYKGAWIEDKQNGLGDIIYPNGSRYTGNFFHGKKNGQGKFIFQDKNIYEGNFVNNEIKGEGSYFWKDGRIFVGNWADNKMNGYGIFIWPDKKKYYGHYVNNLKEGFGTFLWGDGRSFEGYWKEGKQHGYGIIKENNELKYGKWFAGKLINIIDEEANKKKIIKMFNEEKSSDEFGEFNENIERYEKKITENSSNLETCRGNNKFFQGVK